MQIKANRDTFLEKKKGGHNNVTLPVAVCGVGKKSRL